MSETQSNGTAGTPCALREAMRSIIDAADTIPGLTGIRQNRSHSILLGVDIASVDEMPAWCKWFGATSWSIRIDESTRYITEVIEWQGWRILLHAQEPIEAAAVAA